MVPLAHATCEGSDEPAHPHSLVRDLTAHIHIKGWCSDISATDVSARTFQPRKMPKVDVSAKTINFGFGMYASINVLCIF